MPKSFNSPAAGDIGAVIAETREAIDQFIFESESISGDLAEELADYSNAFHTLVLSDATQEARDNATAKLEGLNGFMQQNYEALAEAVDPPEMGKFMDTLRKADDALELGLDFSRYLDAAEKEELEAQANNIDDKTADSLREYEAGFNDLISEISENGQFPNNLADELTDYKNALGTLSDFFSSKEERDAASAKLSGLDGFMRQNYDTLTGLVDPPDMLKFTEMLHEADAVLGLGLNFSQYLDAADREEREADKQKFLEDAEHYDDSIPGDAELAGILYDAKFNADGSINTDYEEQLKDLKDGNFSSLEHSGDREKTLNSLKDILVDIPEGKRTEEQKKAIAAIGNELEKIPDLKKAEEFGRAVYNFGWMAGDTLFRNMYMAGRELPPDHEYNKLINEMKDGQSRFHSEFPPRKKQDGFGLMNSLQTVKYFNKAVDLLKSSGKAETPWGKKAVATMEERTKAIDHYAEYQERQRQRWEKWTSLSDEQKQKLTNLKETISNTLGSVDDHATHVGMRNVNAQIYNIVKNPGAAAYADADKAAESLTKLPDALTEMLEKVDSSSPVFEPALSVLNDYAPEKAAAIREKEAERLQQVSEQMAADVQKQMEDFDKEIEAFKVMKDNLAKVDRAYFKHQNSTEYGNMAKELEDCAKAMSIGELNAAKGRLAQKAKEYLEHTGLGSASIFHKNSETRRKLAFLMLNKTDPTLYAQFEARANQLRSGSDKISAASLEGMEGVGKPLPAVRSIRVEDIAGEAPAQQERKAHNRNMSAQVKTDKKLEEPEAPSFGGLNGPNHN